MKEKKSVAIGYQPTSNSKAPTIVAKGDKALAEEIIALAKESNLLVFEDEALAEFLSQFELGDEIPQQLYQLIAELISFSFVLQGKTPEHWRENGHSRINLTS